MSTVISPATGAGWGPGPAGPGSPASPRRTAARAAWAPGPAAIGVLALTWKLPRCGRTDFGYGSRAARRSVMVLKTLVRVAGLDSDANSRASAGTRRAHAALRYVSPPGRRRARSVPGRGPVW